MKEKLYNFLKGRNGADQLSKVLLYVSVIFLVLAYVLDSLVLSYISLAIVLYSNFRVFSRNLPARIKENQLYLQKTKKIRQFFLKKRNHIFGKDGYKYFSCSKCKSELRVPKKKGKLKVRCPKCENIMEVRT